MTANSQLLTTTPKTKTKVISKQLEQEQNHRNGITWRVINRGVGWRERREKVQGLSSINGR